MAEVKFPTEMVDLPSQGLLYPKDSSLSSGQIEIKYMTAKEEDILTSANLIKSGVVVEKLLESLIIDKSIKVGDLDYASSDPAEITLTLKYDYAILQF